MKILFLLYLTVSVFHWRLATGFGVSTLYNLNNPIVPVGAKFNPLTATIPTIDESPHPRIESTSVRKGENRWKQTATRLIPTTALIATLFFSVASGHSAYAAETTDPGASSAANAKLITGGASTLQSGRTISITRGVNLDRSNFANQNLKGVAFQQSVVRDADFSNANLVGASFFDATLDGSNFEGADLSLANVEMAQFNRASLRNAIMKEAYVSGSTLFTGIKDIEGSDWSDTYLRADQKKYLCEHPTAKGTNPKTGVDTRESLMCKD